MKQFLSQYQINSTSDFSEILTETKTMETDISKTQNFLIQFGFKDSIEKMISDFEQPQTDRKKALLYYFQLKVVLIDLLLVVNDNLLINIFKVYHEKPALFDRLIQGARITPENRPEIIKNLNLYMAFKPELQPARFAIFSNNN